METLLYLIPIVYPPALFLLPPTVASKINIGVKIVKTVANALDKAEKSKGGFTTEISLKRDV
jgi:hypothetical protein